MNISNFFSNFSPVLPVSTEIETFKKLLTFKCPSDYLTFITTYDGGDGYIGKDYLALWSVAEMIEINQFYKDEDPLFFEKYWVFASNTGIFRYAFEKLTGHIIEIDPYDDDYAMFMGTTLQEFLIELSKKH